MGPERISNPLVSVVIPAYNAADYIAECLESVQAQEGHLSTEIIVVDDGSTDETRERVEAFSGVRLISQQNGGPSVARNRGIAAARGDYVAFLDSDDLWTPDKLEKQTSVFRRYPEAGLVIGDCRIFDENGPQAESLFEAAGLGEEFFGHPALVEDPYAKLFRINYVATGTAMVRKGCLRVTGIFDESRRHVEDMDLWFRLALHFPVSYTTHLCEFKRQHGENLSNNSESMAIAYLDVIEKQQRLHGKEMKRRGIRVRPRIAMEQCIIGDRCEREGRTRDARHWYLRGLLTSPSARPAYYLLRTFWGHGSDRKA